MKNRRKRVFFCISALAMLLTCITAGCRKQELDVYSADGQQETVPDPAAEENGTDSAEFLQEKSGTGSEAPPQAAEGTDTGNAQTDQGSKLYFSETAGYIYVYVCGAVAAPGVVQLPEGARVYEALDAAGGMTAEAADYAVNQAAVLTDGEQVTVPTREQAKQWTGDAASGKRSASEPESGGRVSINRAEAEELMTLPGIGEARAADIIEYRDTSGGFGSIEEIKNISGIGDALFEKIKDRIEL